MSVEKLQGEDHLVDLGVDGRITLRQASWK